MRTFPVLPAIVLLPWFAAMAMAHQPRLVMGKSMSPENPVIIAKPEISKAFYGELTGKPGWYRFSLAEPLAFYLNVLAPDVPKYRECRFSVELLDSSRQCLYLLDSAAQAWRPFYEKYGRDNYLMGPEARAPLNPGTYYLRVFSASNQVRYALATGEIESFPPGEIVRTLFALPGIKKRFFGK